MPPLPRRVVLAGLALAWLGIGIVSAVRLRGQAVDDVFITYRYSQNLAAGRGFVFNPGERVFGVTEPAVGLLLGALAWATPIGIPTLGTAFTALMLLGLAGGLFLEGRRRGRAPEGALAGTLILATPLVWGTQGAAGPAVILLLLLAGRVAVGHPGWAAVLAGMAVAFRPDALVGCAILALLLGLDRRRPPWRYATSAGAVVAVLALSAYAWFGSVVPQTLVAKQFHAARNPGSWIGFENFWGFGLHSLRSGPAGWAAPWLLGAGFAGALVALRRASLAERLVVLDGLALFFIYPFLRVPYFGWYAIPPLVASLWGFAQLLGAAWRTARPPWTARAGIALAAAVLACAVGLYWLSGFALFLRQSRPEWRAIVYPEAGRWIDQHAPPEASLAFHEVGMLAFASQRRVEDLLGLVTPRSLPYAREGDIVGAFLSAPTDYFVAHPFADGGALRAIATRDWFVSGYREVARFDHPELGGWIAVYERRPDAVLPPPRPPRPGSSPRPLPG